MWVKIEKRAEKSDIYFKNEDVTKVSIRLDEYAKGHDILACWELGISLRGEDILFKYFNTKEEAEEWVRENIFIDENAGVYVNNELISQVEEANNVLSYLLKKDDMEYDDNEKLGDPLELVNDLKLALRYGDNSDRYKLHAITSAIRMLTDEQNQLTRQEFGR